MPSNWPSRGNTTVMPIKMWVCFMTTLKILKIYLHIYIRWRKTGLDTTKPIIMKYVFDAVLPYIWEFSWFLQIKFGKM